MRIITYIARSSCREAIFKGLVNGMNFDDLTFVNIKKFLKAFSSTMNFFNLLPLLMFAPESFY